MIPAFNGGTADEAWQEVTKAFRGEESCAKGQPSRAGPTRELLHAAISVEDPRQRWVTSRTPVISVAFAIAEIIWIIRGRNDSAFLNFFNSELPEYAGKGDAYHGAYGYRLREAQGIDQLERAYQALKRNPNSRQVVLQIWDAKRDLPDESGTAIAPDVPCNVMSLLKVREGRLEWLQIMRSNDVFRGLPYNLVQFTSLQEILAGWLGTDLGSYQHIADSLHVYDCDSDQIRSSETIVPAVNTDTLALPKAASDEAFTRLEVAVERIIAPETSTDQLMALARTAEGPPAFCNMLHILCAEGMRRRRRADMAEETLRLCSNPVYVHLFDAWLKRWDRNMRNEN